MSAASFFVGPTQVGALLAVAFLGQVLMEPTTKRETFANESPQAAQVSTLTLSGVYADGKTFSSDITLADGRTFSISYTTVAGDTDNTGAATKLAAAINDHEQVGGQVLASAALSVVTLTGRSPGIGFTVAATSADLAAATTTAAAGADDMPIARVVLTQGTTTQGSKKAFLPKSSILAAQVSTLTVAALTAGQQYAFILEVDGESYPFAVLFDTDANTSAAAIEAAINGLLPADTILAAVATNVVTLTAEVEGKPFTVRPGSGLTLAHTTEGGLADALSLLGGVSERPDTLERTDYDADEGVWPALRGFNATVAGKIQVAVPAGAVLGFDVYLETDGADAGKVYPTAASTRLKLPSWVRWGEHDATNNTALLRFNDGAL